VTNAAVCHRVLYVYSGKKLGVAAIKENFSTSFIYSKTTLVILYHGTDTEHLGVTVALATSVLINTLT
jgi:hypothetical protein